MEKIKEAINKVDDFLRNHKKVKSFLTGAWKVISLVIVYFGLFAIIVLPVWCVKATGNWLHILWYILEFAVLGGVFQITEDN